MKRKTLQHHLERGGLRDQFAGDLAAGALVGIGRDPDDARCNCIVLYVPPGFAHPLLERVMVGGEAVRVVRRERGGALRAYAAS